jgi:hypothetical protein
MKKITNYTKLKKGRVYNRVYVGDNKAYAKINGKETFLVLRTEPHLEVVVLFDQFGSPLADDLRGGVITFGAPEIAFKNFELFEPSNKSEWFKKSTKVKSLGAALKRKLITLKAIKVTADWRGQCPFMPTFGRDNKLKGVQCSFRVEGKMKDPFLQTVFIVWKNWERLIADFKKYGIKVQT